MTQRIAEIERETSVAAAVPPPRQPTLRTWTVDEFEAMIETGLLHEADAVELLEGQIIEKMAINAPHAFVTDTLADIFKENLRGTDYAIGVQNPIRLSDGTRPEPDVRVAAGPKTQYRTRIPEPADIVLLAEVADSSINIDRDLKLPLYASAGIPEYWIIDINTSRIECNTGPQVEGTYATKRTYKMGETIAHELVGEVVLQDLFGEASESAPDTAE